MQALSFYYVVAVWFFIITLFDNKTRPSAAILFSWVSINILSVDFYDVFKDLTFEEEKLEFIKYIGCFALLMTMITTIDKTAKIQALILCLTITCHSMILLYLLTNNPALEFITFYFYAYYEELLISTAIMHMVVSKNGMVKIVNGFIDTLQTSFNRCLYSCRDIIKITFQRETFKAKK